MALIDVSELLDDPDFVDPVSVLRTTIVVDNDGISQKTTQTFTGLVASVQPASGASLRTLAEATRVDGMMEVYIKFEIRQALDDQEADRILWRGHKLYVTTLNDWSNFGVGYYKAICTVEGVTD